MIIYKTTNSINGKWYIGLDSKNNPKYLGSGILIKKAVKKYGKENFKKETLELCLSIEELNKAEIKWIKNTNAVENIDCYNLSYGGDGKGKHSKKTRAKISKAHKGKVVSEEAKKKMRQYTGIRNSQYGVRGKDHHLYGKLSPKKGTKATKQQVIKNAIAHGARFFEVFTKGGDYVGEWLVQSNCARDLQIHNTSISLCLKKQRKSTGGYIFRYKLCQI